MKKKPEELENCAKNNNDEDYFCFVEMTRRPIQECEIRSLAKKVVKWARDDKNALKLSAFTSEAAISYNDWLRWCQKYPFLQEAHEQALRLLGNRRETGALKGKLNAGMVNTTMPMYDPEHRKMLKWKHSLRVARQEEKAQQQQIIVIERFPSSDAVPEKKSVQTITSNVSENDSNSSQ
jgi:hypothetical protein